MSLVHSHRASASPKFNNLLNAVPKNIMADCDAIKNVIAFRSSTMVRGPQKHSMETTDVSLLRKASVQVARLL